MSKPVVFSRPDAPDDPESAGVYYAEEAQISLYYPEEKRISLLDVLLVIVRNRRLVGLCVAAFTALGLLSAILPEEPRYEASATVIRESTGGGGQSIPGLGTLARFGINLGGASTGLSASAYPNIMASREVRLAVVRDTFYISTWDATLPLVDYLNQPPGAWESFTRWIRRYTIGLPKTLRDALQKRPVPPASARAPQTAAAGDGTAGGAAAAAVPAYPTPREEAAMSAVRRLVSTSVDARTGLMTITATTTDPRLSADLISSFIKHLEARVREINTEKARQNLQFITHRFAEVEEELQQAEGVLARFLDRNNSMQSAQLITQRERLQRQVEFKSQLYLSLQAQLTQAEVELQRSMPVITVLEQPVPPRGPVGSNPEAIILLGLVFGGLVGIGLAFAKTFVESQDADEESKEKMAELRGALPSGKVLKRLRPWKRNGVSQ